MKFFIKHTLCFLVLLSQTLVWGQKFMPQADFRAGDKIIINTTGYYAIKASEEPPKPTSNVYDVIDFAENRLQLSTKLAKEMLPNFEGQPLSDESSLPTYNIEITFGQNGENSLTLSNEEQAMGYIKMALGQYIENLKNNTASVSAQQYLSKINTTEADIRAVLLEEIRAIFDLHGQVFLLKTPNMLRKHQSYDQLGLGDMLCNVTIELTKQDEREATIVANYQPIKSDEVIKQLWEKTQYEMMAFSKDSEVEMREGFMKEVKEMPTDYTRTYTYDPREPAIASKIITEGLDKNMRKIVEIQLKH